MESTQNGIGKSAIRLFRSGNTAVRITLLQVDVVSAFCCLLPIKRNEQTSTCRGFFSFTLQTPTKNRHRTAWSIRRESPFLLGKGATRITPDLGWRLLPLLRHSDVSTHSPLNGFRASFPLTHTLTETPLVASFKAHFGKRRESEILPNCGHTQPGHEDLPDNAHFPLFVGPATH